MLVATAMVIAFLIKTFVAQAFFIPSGSMIPQLNVGDRVVVSKLAYRLHDPHRGDIVVFDAPNQVEAKDDDGPAEQGGQGHPRVDRAVDAVHRGVHQAGDRPARGEGRGPRRAGLRQRPGAGGALPAPGPTTRDFAAVVLGAGELWVMGDNRENSSDSRVFGPIAEDTVVGRAFVKVWPVPDLSFL